MRDIWQLDTQKFRCLSIKLLLLEDLEESGKHQHKFTPSLPLLPFDTTFLWNWLLGFCFEKERQDII